MATNVLFILFAISALILSIHSEMDVTNFVNTTERRVPSRFTDIGRSQSRISNSTVPDPRVVYWFPTPCDSLAERGYTCYSCGEALHCMVGNVGLLAFCLGRRPYCNNGVCSDLPGTKCNIASETNVAQVVQDSNVSEPTPHRVRPRR